MDPGKLIKRLIKKKSKPTWPVLPEPPYRDTSFGETGPPKR
jgi:hypothetical protein